MPHWKTHLHPWINVINMEKKWAVIPGDGTARAHFITTQDMARLVARLMDLQAWSKVTTIVGDNLSLNEVVELAERTRGKPIRVKFGANTSNTRSGCKFHVVHDSLDKLKSGKLSFASEFPPIGFGDGDEAFYALIHYQAGLGHFLLPTDDVLNDKIADMKPLTTAEEVMAASWGGK
jgi:hypothetical protein